MSEKLENQGLVQERQDKQKRIIAIAIFILGSVAMIAMFVFGTLPQLQYARFPTAELIDGVEIPQEVFEAPEMINSFIEETQTTLEVEEAINELNVQRQEELMDIQP
jgi:hypothetical protein